MVDLTAEEREQRLIKVSDEYMRGDITVEEFEAAEQRYMTDYGLLLQALARQLRPAQVRSFDRVRASLGEIARRLRQQITAGRLALFL